MRNSCKPFRLVLALVFLISCSTLAFAVPSVELVGPTNDIFVGDTFNVDVVANGVVEEVDPLSGWMDEILSFGFDLNFDMSAFAFNSVTVGFLFLDDSLMWPDTDVAGSTFPGVSGDDILLASQSFTSLAAGTFSLGITSDFLDPFGAEGLSTFLYSGIYDPQDPFSGLGPKIDMTQNLDIEVQGAPVPEPSTMILMGLGFVGMVGIRARKKS